MRQWQKSPRPGWERPRTASLPAGSSERRAADPRIAASIRKAGPARRRPSTRSLGANHGETKRSAAQPIARLAPPYAVTFLTAGGFHVPLMIDGDFSFGQYSRIIRTNLPCGAGSQLLSLSAPGD